MDAVAKSPFRSPAAFTNLVPCANFTKETCAAETPEPVGHTRFGSIALVPDHVPSVDRTCSEPALRKAIPGQDQ